MQSDNRASLPLSIVKASQHDVEPADFCLVFHGLFGMASNVMPIARIISNIAMVPTSVYCVDMPNHGHSPDLNPCDYPDMATEVDKLVTELTVVHKGKMHIMGHSMGGKLAMAYALLYPQKTASLTVLDIAPRAYTSKTDTEMNTLIEIMNSAPSTRQELREILNRRIEDVTTRAFLQKNFLFEQGTCVSKLRIDIIRKNYERLWQFSYFDSNRMSYAGPTLFVQGMQSDYIVQDDYRVIQEFFSKARIATVDAGHIIHADNPRALAECMAESLIL